MTCNNGTIQREISKFICRYSIFLKKELEAQHVRNKEAGSTVLRAIIINCNLKNDSSWIIKLTTQDTSDLKIKENLVEKSRKLSGIIIDISSKSEFTILSLDKGPFNCSQNCKFTKKHYRETFLLTSLNQLTSQDIYPNNSAQTKLRNILLGLEDPTLSRNNITLNPINQRLNNEQKSAVKQAIKQNEVCIIHGPPGTGKTTTLVEIIMQEIVKGGRVMVCANANVAVDNLMLKVLKVHKEPKMGKIIRIGHPGKITEKLIPNSLFSLTNTTSPNNNTEILLHASAVFGTLSTCNFYRNSQQKTSLSLLPNDFFSLTVIDEASQTLETHCWSIIPYSKKLVLAGDHHQLPPTVITKNAQARKNLSISLMERLMNNTNIKKIPLFSAYNIE